MVMDRFEIFCCSHPGLMAHHSSLLELICLIFAHSLLNRVQMLRTNHSVCVMIFAMGFLVLLIRE